MTAIIIMKKMSMDVHVICPSEFLFLLKIRKLLGDKAFYKMVLSLTVPIIVQNGITNFVNLLDNIMVGRLGTEQLSGVGIANQLTFVFTLCLFGGLSGAGIFTAQFFGKQDAEGMRYTFRFKLLTAVLILAVGGLSWFPLEMISLPCFSMRKTQAVTWR